MQKRILYIGLIPAMVVPMAGAFLYFVMLGPGVWTGILYAVTKAFTLVWPLVGYFLIEGQKPKWGKINWSRHWQATPLGFWTGGVLLAVMLGGYFLTPIGGFVKSFGPDVRERIDALGLLEWYIPFALFLSLAHSLLEEFYWRWYVFGRAKSVFPRITAYLLGAFSFAAHHYVELFATMSFWTAAGLGMAVAIGGLLWCWMVDKQQTLAGAWISHILVDAGMMIVGYDMIFRL